MKSMKSVKSVKSVMSVMSIMSLLIMLLILLMGCSEGITLPLKKLYAVFFQVDNITHEPVLRQIELEYNETFHFENEVQQEDGELMYNISRTRMVLYPLDLLLDVPILVVPGMTLGYDEKQNISSTRWRSTRRNFRSNTSLTYTTIPEQLERESDIFLMVNETTLNKLGLQLPVTDQTHFSWHWLMAGVIIAGVIIAVILFCLFNPKKRGGCLKNRTSATSCVDPRSVQLIEC